MANRSIGVEAAQDKLHGVEVGALRQVYETFAANPAAGKLSLKARATWQRQGMRATGIIGPFALDGQSVDRPTRNYTINYDAWQEFPGCSDAGPEAIETVLSAMGACLIAMTSWHATRMGVALESLEAHVSTTFDGQEFLFSEGDIEGTARGFGDVSYELRVKAPTATDEQFTALERLAAACPVCAMVGGKLAVRGSLQRV